MERLASSGKAGQLLLFASSTTMIDAGESTSASSRTMIWTLVTQDWSTGNLAKIWASVAFDNVCDCGGRLSRSINAPGSPSRTVRVGARARIPPWHSCSKLTEKDLLLARACGCFNCGGLVMPPQAVQFGNTSGPFGLVQAQPQPDWRAENMLNCA